MADRGSQAVGGRAQGGLLVHRYAPAMPSFVARLVLACLAMLVAAGCVSVKPEIETRWLKEYALERGAVRVQYEHDLPTCWRAAKAAVARLGLAVHEEIRHRKLAGPMQDTSYKLEFESPGTTWTEVRIKVGKLGDEDRSRRLHAVIAEELDLLAAR